MAGQEFEDFECVICERNASQKWVYRWSEYPVPPVCNYCRSHYGPKNIAAAGEFRDRTVILTGLALAEKLATDAAHMQWRTSPQGRAFYV